MHSFLQNPVFLLLLTLAPRFRSLNMMQLFHWVPTMACLLCISSMSVRDFEEVSLHYWNNTKITVSWGKKSTSESPFLGHLQSFLFLTARFSAHCRTPLMRWMIVKFYILICGNEIRMLCGSRPSHPQIFQLSLCYHIGGKELFLSCVPWGMDAAWA